MAMAEMKTEDEQIAIGALYEEMLAAGRKPTVRGDGYEVLECEGVDILTMGGKFVQLKCLSRHKTPKHLVKVEVKSAKGIDSVVVTTDHICMVFNRDHFAESCKADDLDVGACVSVYDPQSKRELVGSVSAVTDLGETDAWVYDAEVDDPSHTFYANNVLVHNSQFLNIACVSSHIRQQYDLAPAIADWTDDQKLLLWNYINDFVEKDLNPHIQAMVRDDCHTSQSGVLRYSLEYMGDVGIYEAKKHYAVHKIVSEGPEVVDKIKFSGIELKKNTVDIRIKEYLNDIYEGILVNRWKEGDYSKYIEDAYEEFKQLSIDDVAMWKGYNTESHSTGQFLEMQKGSTGIGKACVYYNHLIDKLGLGKKYDQIRVGQKVRFTYIKDTNPYGISCIAYPDGQWPDEFDKLFEVDYDVMFDKLIIAPLKGFLLATKFTSVDPKKQVVEDIFSL